MSQINDIECDENGYHPEHKHLVWCDVESHHSRYLVTSPASEGSFLLSEDEVHDMFGEDVFEYDGGYVSDEYLSVFE
jgi:hypothetical protein